jgi:predicted AlkP superfamily phosphohydrolase/phosphomutase
MFDKRVLVIGLDGATWGILQPLMQRGYLPNLNHLYQNGASGTLRSTDPPLTPVAWTSCFTGVNPGKHGVFGFYQCRNPKQGWALNNANMIRSPQVWDYLNNTEKKVAIYNVPMTFPVHEVNGVLVAGFDTPSNQSEYTYPQSLKSQLKDKGYKIDLFIKRRRRDYFSDAGRAKLAQDLAGLVEKRTQICMDVTRSVGVADLTVIVYETPDRIQHYMWDAIENIISGKYKLNALDLQVINCYKALDKAIGQWMELVDPTQILVVSDHGFQKLDSEFLVNRWLIDHGYMVAKEQNDSQLRSYIHSVLKDTFSFMADRIQILEQVRQKRFTVNRGMTARIDWGHTIAYAGEASENSIYIRTDSLSESDEARALVRSIKDMLSAETDQQGNPIFETIKAKDEAYQGAETHNAPDLVLSFKPGFESSTLLSNQQKEYIKKAGHKGSGCHAYDGIVLLWGEGIYPNNQLTSQIADVTPTILYLLGEPISQLMDGRVIENALNQEWIAAHPPMYSKDIDQFNNRRPTNYNDADSEKIAKRLADLGYLD